MKITIKEKDYEVRYTLRAMMIWESITKRVFEIKNITDQWVFFYSLLVASNPDENVTFDDFMDAVDEDPGIIGKFNEFISTEARARAVFGNDGGGEEKKSSQ